MHWDFDIAFIADRFPALPTSSFRANGSLYLCMGASGTGIAVDTDK